MLLHKNILNKEGTMNAITLLKGFLLSRFIHSMRIPLLITVSAVFINHSAIAKNKPNKTPASDDGGGGGYTSTSLTGIPQQNSNQNNNLITYSPIAEKKYTSSSLTNSLSQPNGLIPQAVAQNNIITTGNDKLEVFYNKLLSYNVLQNVQQQVNASAEDFKLFVTYYHDKIFGNDRNVFWQMVEQNRIQTDADVKSFANNQVAEYIQLYQKFLTIKKDYPNSVNEYLHPTPPAPICNPGCDNIDFENGTLSAWSAFYATNTSSISAFSNTAPVGGPCGAVTKSAGPDPSTNNDFQVAIMRGPGLDPVAGALIPIVCPTGGTTSCRIGDSTRNGAQMGILQQTFLVTPNNCDFVYMYAVVLENPSHVYYQQPYFNVQMLDQNGNPIPNCGNYSVVSGPGLPGYTPIYYPTDADTVYCKPWSTVFVPLKAYIGQCITIKVTAADCALGGHFGYAYFDATCLNNIVPSAPVICGHNITLTAPAGVSSYQWSGPCIVGPSNVQTITVGCAGTYKVIIASIVNPLCSDTLSINVPSGVPPVVNITATNITCNGRNNGIAIANVSNGQAPYTYLWSPGGSTNSSISNLSVGTYKVVVTDANRCSDSATVVITQPAVLTASISSLINVRCNGGNSGSATASANGGTAPYNYAWSNGNTGATDNNLSVGTYTVTIQDLNGCTATASVTLTQPNAVVAGVSAVTNITCNGGNNGTATANGNGGVAPYNYLWSNGNTNALDINLSVGTYTVTVSDANGCTATTTATITQPAAVVANAIVANNVSCNGGNNGSASVSVTGGTMPYAYLWSNGGTAFVNNNLTVGTYSVTVTDANGCTGTASVTIAQPSPIVAIVGVMNNVSCFGGNNGATGSYVTGGMAPYSYLWSNGNTFFAAVNLSAGTYTLTVTDANGCTETASTTITQPSAIIPTISSVVNLSCNNSNNGSATASATGGVPTYTYTWSNGNTGATASNLSAGTYTVTVGDSHSCNGTASITITQPASIIASVSAVTNVSCFGGNNGTATANANGGAAPYAYLWSNGNTNATALNLNAGTYTVTVTDANGCTVTTNATITEPAQLVVLATTLNPVGCNGGLNGTAQATVNGGIAPYNYLWSNGNTSSANNNLSAGTYTVTVTDANACTNSTSVIVSQPAQLTATTGSITNVSCNGGNTGSATAIPGGGTPPFSYLWTPGNNRNITANNLVAGNYTLNVTDANGCSATAVVAITQPLPLAASFTSQEPLCSAMSNGSLDAQVRGGVGPYNYSWSTVPAQTAQMATGLSAGTYTLVVTDANGCTLNSPTALTQPASLSASITNTINDACYGYHVGKAGATAIGGTAPYTYAWTTNPVQAYPVASGLSAGTYTVTVTDSHGCTNTTTATITQPSRIMTTVAGQDSICKGNNTTLTASSNGGNGGPYFYTWSNGNGPGNTIIVSPNYYTTYTVTASDGAGCHGDTVTINVMPLAITPVAVTVSPSQAVCAGDSVTVSVSVDKSNSGNVTIQWSNNLVGAGPFRLAPLTTTTYSVTVTDRCGNNVVKTVTVTVNPLPVINIPQQSGNSCKAVTLNFSDNNQNNAGSSYVWNFGDNQTSHQSSPSHDYDQTGRYVVTVNITSPYGCKSSTQAFVDIKINPSSSAHFVVDPHVESVANPVFTFADNSANTTSWEWNFGDGSTSRTQNPVHTYPSVIGSYNVHLVTTNSYGCADSTDDSVHIIPDFRIYIPNAFSPNGDDLNDQFTAKGIGIATFMMMIFDRWGNLLYTTHDINKGWNGRVGSSNEVAQEDTYVYKIEVTDIFGEPHSYLGAATLIK